MLMGMASHPLAGGTIGFRTMLSLDPLMGKEGYPLLLQTGETANGTTPLVDRQHPHDLFMELATSYSHPLSDNSSAFIYVGYPGEPALGPATFMHRFSGMDSPEAPIDHHWLDSTHISYGVTTLGYVWRNWKVETSAFNGREPDQFRWNFDKPRLNSYSGRPILVATTILENFGYRFEVAHNGKEALQKFTPDKYSLILMDVEMPVMDGYEAAKLIRQSEKARKSPSIPVIAMTAHALKGDRERCIEAGMDDYLRKPFNPHELQTVLSRHMVEGVPLTIQ